MNTIEDEVVAFINAKNEKRDWEMINNKNLTRNGIHTEVITAIHGRHSLVEVVKILGTFLCTDNPYRIRDAEKV